MKFRHAWVSFDKIIVTDEKFKTYTLSYSELIKLLNSLKKNTVQLHITKQRKNYKIEIMEELR